MHKLILAAVAIVLAVSSPALAKCHGHDAGATWELNISSWSISELAELGDLSDQLKQLNPSSTDGAGGVAAVIDQFECRAGMTHEQAVSQLFRIARVAASLRASTPDPQAAAKAALIEWAKSH